MNSQQRKFLIERIQQKVKEKISELDKTLLAYPSASNYIFKAILNDELELQSVDVIKEALKSKALAAKEGENWMSNERMGMDKERTIRMLIKELIVLPQDYKTEVERVSSHNKKVKEGIASLKLQLDTIEVRVQLASDKTLQNLINEVDDMGDLSLIDTKIKLLN
jgi:hypothetical protein